MLGELGCESGLNLSPAEKWETLLAGAGLHRIRAHSYEERFSYPDCAVFLRSVKSSGAGYAPCVLAPGTLSEAMRRYDERFADGAGVERHLRGRHPLRRALRGVRTGPPPITAVRRETIAFLPIPAPKQGFCQARTC